MKNIFLVPVDTKHFKDTIIRGRRLSSLGPYVSSAQFNEIPLGDEEVHYWGTKPGPRNTPTFATMRRNDEVLFYQSGKYIGAGIIGLTMDNPKLAYYTWGKDKIRGGTWNLIYFFADLILCRTAIDAAEIATVFELPQAMLRGFTKVEDEPAQAFLQKYGSVANFISGHH